MHFRGLTSFTRPKFRINCVLIVVEDIHKPILTSYTTLLRIFSYLMDVFLAYIRDISGKEQVDYFIGYVIE